MWHAPALLEQAQLKTEEINDVSIGEPMPRCCPKASKSGGLHNHAHEPRKLVPLGKILENSVERKSGVIVHNEVAQNLE